MNRMNLIRSGYISMKYIGFKFVVTGQQFLFFHNWFMSYKYKYTIS